MGPELGEKLDPKSCLHAFKSLILQESPRNFDSVCRYTSIKLWLKNVLKFLSTRAQIRKKIANSALDFAVYEKRIKRYSK